MGGAHRAAGGGPKVAAEGARWLVSFVALLAVTLGVVALLVYALVIGTSLERAIALLTVCLLAYVVLRLRSEPHTHWQAAGVALVAICQAMTSWADLRLRPAGRADTISAVATWISAAALVCLVLAVAPGARRGAARPIRHLSQGG